MTEAASIRCCGLLTELLALDAATESKDAAHKLRDFLECFVGLSMSEQEEMRSLLHPPEARQLASLSVVAAEQALAEKQDAWLTWALLAHDVEHFRDDPRNNLRLLVVVAYAAEHLGSEVRALFERTASMMSPRSASYIRAFIARPPSLRTLQAMGVRAETQGGRVRFVFE